ncbi:MAG: iron-containing alcohol dehydrogenase family protein [Tetragenococcus sp.]|nr:iron-containing alcohol dehydrogenase family protein [Tetragenococcus sp.]
MQQLIVRGAPQIYECAINSWEKLPHYLTARKIKNVLLLHGKDSWTAAQPFFPDLSHYTVYKKYYGGECTDEKADEIVSTIENNNIDGIIACGGGKIADLGKTAADKAQLPVFILPTLAATCAAYSSLSVIYNLDGSMKRYEMFSTSSAAVLVEPRVILHSPQELMIAGIGDTLAKWYEAAPVIEQLTYQPPEIQIALFAAQRCRDILLRDSNQALEAMQTSTVNQALQNVIETNILLAGMVGGFGDDYGRTSGAHSIHDALTILPESHQTLHGFKVAYGILVQLMIEDKKAEIERLLPFYNQLHLPTSLKDIGLSLSEEDYRQVGQRATLPWEQIHYLKEEITTQVVVDAMKKIENLN